MTDVFSDHFSIVYDICRAACHGDTVLGRSSVKKLASLIESSTPDDAALLKRLTKKAAKNPAHFVQSDEGGSKPAPSATCSVSEDCKWPNCRRDCVIKTDPALSVEQEERGALSLDVESVNYSIELSIEQFEKLEGVDFLDIVLSRMKKAGAGNVEYNGHFGPNVFFTSSEDDAPAVLSVVCDLVGTKARAASTSTNVDRFDPYRLKVAEECCERLMSACTDAGCPDGVRMDDWIRENVRSTSANVAQYQTKLRNPILPECDVWINVSEEGARTAREKYSDVYAVRELFERSANVAQGAEAVAFNEKAEWKSFQEWAWKKEGTPIGLMEGRDAVWTGWLERAKAAPPAQTALTDDARDALIERLKRRYGNEYTVRKNYGETVTHHVGFDKHPLVGEAVAALTAAQSASASEGK